MKKIIIIYCIILFLLIAYPLFISTGYMFALDHTPFFYPDSYHFSHIPFSGQNTYWLLWLTSLTAHTIPGFIWDRVIFLITFGGGMVGVYQLLKKTKNIYAILFGTSLLFINPFFYGRILDGQDNVYLVSVGCVWLLYFLKQVFEKQGYKYSIITGIFSLLLVWTSLYSVYFIALACCVFSVTYFLGTKKKGEILKKSIILGAIIVGINATWAIPMIRDTLITPDLNSPDAHVGVKSVQNFGDDYRKIFHTDPGEYGVMTNVLMMKGYWGERQPRFIPSQGINKQYIWVVIALWGIIILGIYERCYKKNNSEKLFTYTVLTLAIFGFVLTLGTAEHTPVIALNQWLYDHLPLYKGFREPQKWIIFLIIAYVYFGSYGIREIYRMTVSFGTRKIILIVLVALPILYTPNMLLGFNQQLSVRNFPPEWSQVRTFLHTIPFTQQCENQKTGGKCYTFLYFPWHGYIELPWIGKTVSDQRLTSYLSNDNLTGDNSQMGPIYNDSGRPESGMIERFVRFGGRRGSIAERDFEILLFHNLIKNLGVHYIVLNMTSEYKNYVPFLEEMVKQGYLSMKMKNPFIQVYKVELLTK